MTGKIEHLCVIARDLMQLISRVASTVNSTGAAEHRRSCLSSSQTSLAPRFGQSVAFPR